MITTTRWSPPCRMRWMLWRAPNTLSAARSLQGKAAIRLAGVASSLISRMRTSSIALGMVSSRFALGGRASPLTEELRAMKPVKVGLLGIGTVGSGTFRVLERNREEITRRAGRRIEIAWVAARDLDRARSVVGPGVVVRNDVLAAVTDPDIDIVVEVIGG